MASSSTGNGIINREPINKLLLTWLLAWKNDCARIGSKMEYVYLRAIKSLQSHKENLYTGADCSALKYFGDKICARIDKKIAEHFNLPSETSQSTNNVLSSQDLPMSQLETDEPGPSSQSSQISSQLSQSSPTKKKTTRKKTERKYVPRYRSGGYAILMALYRAELEHDLDVLPKNEILQRAQPYSDEPMINPNGIGYSSWSSMNTLIKHGYVDVKKHRYSTYRLTDAGREIASRLVSTEEEMNQDFIPINGRIVLEPGTFDIYLIIDSREQYSGGGSDMRKTGIITEFMNREIKCQMAKLPVGDFAWVARERLDNDLRLANQPYRKELLLDYVIERKRYDDLASSIKSGRLGEQKYRLLHCGVRRPMYLIEDFGYHRRNESLYQAMYQTIMDTMVIDECLVKQTRSYSETIDYLAMMTKYLTSMYSCRKLYSCSKDEMISGNMSANHFMTLNEFNLCAEKITNFTSQEMFIKHLLKFKGLSVAKAKAIVNYYPTVTALLEAYELCETEKEKEFLLSEITYGNFERKLGPNLSRKIYRFYTKKLTNPPDSSNLSQDTA